MVRWRCMVAMVAAAGLLGGCAGAPVREAKAPKPVEHTAPDPVPLPAPGTFDQAAEQGELAAARTARQAGDLGLAKTAAESAVGHWPGDAAAWAELQRIDLAQGDAAGAHFAGFFQAKAEFAATLPPRVAALGFQSLGEEEPSTGRNGYDQRTIDMAQRIAGFYAMQDTTTVRLDGLPPENPFLQEHPYAGMLVVGGIAAAVLTGAKEVK